MKSTVPSNANDLLSVSGQFRNILNRAQELHGRLQETADRLRDPGPPVDGVGEAPATPTPGGILGDLMYTARSLSAELDYMSNVAARIENIVGVATKSEY